MIGRLLTRYGRVYAVDLGNLIIPTGSLVLASSYIGGDAVIGLIVGEEDEEWQERWFFSGYLLPDGITSYEYGTVYAYSHPRFAQYAYRLKDDPRIQIVPVAAKLPDNEWLRQKYNQWFFERAEAGL